MSSDLIPESTNTPLTAPFQARVQPWMMACFGEMIAGDREERNHRFLEEALELVQACGCTAHEAHQLVDYVFGRPIGEPRQEVGGVMVTLAALCLANDLDLHEAAEAELARIWTKVKVIRAKQAAKPKHSPLPQSTSSGRLEAPDRHTDTLLRLPEVLRRTGLSRATIYRKADKGEFPAPRRIGANSVAWYENDVTAWMQAPMAWRAGHSDVPLEIGS